jgi:hypothetical protein
MGLPDDETIPSHLQELLARRAGPRPVHVYNFGAGYYFSSQERVRFEQLLLAGFVPDVAVFVDGLNDFFLADGIPALTARLASFVADPAPRRPHPLLEVVRALPVGVAAERVRAWTARRPAPAPALAPGGPAAPPRPPERARIAEVIARYRRNKQMIAAVASAHGVRPLFVWQPVPTYKYDLAYHAFHPAGFGRVELTQAGYAEMEAVAGDGTLGRDFVWCADIGEGRRQELYLDLVHYTPRMARRVAACVAKGMLRRGLWP